MPFFGPHVSYLDMITEAISNLRERSGSSEDSIAKFIKEHYQGGTPRNFRRELKSNLKKYVESKELVKVKNSYKIPVKKETKKKETKKGGKKPKKETKKKETKKAEKKPKKERSAEQTMGDLMNIQKKLDKLNQWTLAGKRKLEQKHEKSLEKAIHATLKYRLQLMDEYDLELEKEEEKLHREKRELRRSIYNKRSETIKDVPCFWLNAFLSHCAVGDMLSEEDHKIFQYLEHVNIEETENPTLAYTITLDFDEQNPYFLNASLSKKISHCVEGVDTKGCTINWKDNIYGRGYPSDGYGFFTWFSDCGNVSEGNLDEFAELIIEDLWPNAIKYYINGNHDYEKEGDIIEEVILWAAKRNKQKASPVNSPFLS